ncbi:MAG: GEVED domain-containing protein, partial [Bernardetiaceae bacterium]|nr:GEVED domain-containing protein [Bernardetiaceae bacterium]
MIGSGIGGTPIGASQATNIADSRIENVTFATINNTSNTPGACTGYTDFRQSVAAPSLFAGQNVSFSVRLGTCGANANKHVRIYLDWNGDGDFDDAGEMIAQSTAPVNGVGLASLNVSSVTVPSHVSVDGVATLRVVCVETNDVNDIAPTGSYLKGETEDYLVRFTRPATDVGVESIVSPAGAPCGGSIPVTVRIRNFGTGSVSNIPVQFTVNGGSPVTATFTGTIAGGGIATFTVGSFTAAPSTAYTIVAQTNLAADADPTNNSRTVSITTAATPSILASSSSNCGAVNPTDLISLLATVSGSTDAVHWYTQATGGTRIASGNNTTITKAQADALPVPNTIYAGLNEFSATGVGPANTTLGGSAVGTYAQATARPIINVTTPFRIATARMYISSTASGTTPTGTPGTPVGSIIFRVIRQSDGQIMSTSVVQARVTSAAGDIFPVDILFPAAGTYELGIEYEGTFGLFRNNGGVPTGFYPVNIGPSPSVAQIVNTTAPGTGFYYWLYDMTVTSAGCPVGSRVPVTIDNTPPLVANITPSGSTVLCDNGATVTLNANTGTGFTYRWQRRTGTDPFTDIAGATGASFNAGRVAADPVTTNEVFEYRVIVTRPDGCQATSSPVTVTVVPWPTQVRIIPQNGSTQLCTGATPNLVLRASATIGLNNNTNFNYEWRRNGVVVATGTGTGANGWEYTATQTGEYTVTITPATPGSGCGSLTSPPITITAETPVLSNLNAIACAGSPVQLSGNTTSGHIHWYTAATGGTWLGTGNSITVPAISTPTTYYAAVNEFTGTVPSPPMGVNGGFTNFGSGFMYFNAEQPFQINQLSMRLQNTGTTAGTVILFLMDKDFGGVIASRSWTVPAGTSANNFNLTMATPIVVPEPGNNYALLVQFSGATMQGYRNNTGIGLSYPYAIPGIVSFTGTNQSPSTAFYYYMHNIQISTIGCATTPRTAVEAIPGPATATLSASASTIELCDGETTNLSVALTGRAPWSLTYTNGTTNTTVNNITASPYVITVGTAGNYSLVSVTDANNCTTGNTVSTNTVTVVTPPRIAVAYGSTSLASGDNINVGTTTYGTPLDITLTLTNTCNGTLSIASLPITGPFSVVGATLPINIAPNNSATVTVRLLANAAGAANGTLTVNSNAVNQPLFLINLSGTVNKAIATFRADNKTIIFGQPIPTLTFTVTGLQFGQTFTTSGITGAPALSTVAVMGSPVGTYPITISAGTLASANYDFAFVDGTLRIVPVPPPILPPPSALNMSTLPVLPDRVFNPAGEIINPQM